MHKKLMDVEKVHVSHAGLARGPGSPELQVLEQEASPGYVRVSCGTGTNK